MKYSPTFAIIYEEGHKNMVARKNLMFFGLCVISIPSLGSLVQNPYHIEQVVPLLIYQQIFHEIFQ